MKYDILVQTFTSSLVRKQYLSKKIAFFSPKIGGFFFGQNPFQAIIRLYVKKVAWTTKPLV